MVILHFKENEIEHNNKSWYGVLHHRTQKQIWNHGNGGTSLQYSKQQLFSYLNSKYYKEDDYIIFVTTSYTRVPSFPSVILNTNLIFRHKYLHSYR